MKIRPFFNWDISTDGNENDETCFNTQSATNKLGTFSAIDKIKGVI